MDVLEKIRILAEAAKYDASCASSGSNRKNTPGGLGNGSSSPMGICHSWAADGRCISLLKILFTNYCTYDCVYCVNRRSNDIPRCAFTVDEIVDLTIKFYRRNYIEGLFLSSGVLKSPDYTMELLLQVVKKLRLEQHFNGYIHLKVIPGASQELVREAGTYADRLSVNMEIPSEPGLKLLAPGKRREDILTPMAYIGQTIRMNDDEKKYFKRVQPFSPAGQSTQLIVGATPDPDHQILRLAEQLYRRVRLKRVYYSAYIPVNTNPLLPAVTMPPLRRENRLYQADWLLRFYHFQADEILDQNQPFLESELDPKTSWALRNLHRFPIEVNRADYETLLRVPGLGLKSAERIVASRRSARLSFDDLTKMGVVMKRARYFLTCQGKSLDFQDNSVILRRKLMALEGVGKERSTQLTLGL
ncbi:MAG TPA: putative DNA modification/repair radical SAM protein [Bacillota bacterium]|nr:putative DNA modification/repair radical SAM protein [Bacillota bacterium]